MERNDKIIMERNDKKYDKNINEYYNFFIRYSNRFYCFFNKFSIIII